MVIDRQKFIKYVLFLIIVLVVFVMVFSSKHDDKSDMDRLSQIEDIRMNVTTYLQLTDSVSLLLDSSFYGQYRIKPNDYSFYRTSGDTLSIPISLSERIKNNVFPILKKLSITSLWKDESENFYRYELSRSYSDRIQVIVLRKQDRDFKFPEGSAISNTDSTSDIKDIGNESEQNFLFKINERVRVYL
jgi:hypothetical protein